MEALGYTAESLFQNLAYVSAGSLALVVVLLVFRSVIK